MDCHIPVLLGTSLLALLGMNGCGGSRIPEDELTAQLNEQILFTERLAGVESLEIEEQTTRDGVTELQATVLSHNGFTATPTNAASSWRATRIRRIGPSPI